MWKWEKTTGMRSQRGQEQDGRALYKVGLERCREMRTAQARASVVARDVVCQVCSRSFRRESDKRHKCVAERQRPVYEQSGARRWFRSRGGLAVHRFP